MSTSNRSPITTSSRYDSSDSFSSSTNSNEELNDFYDLKDPKKRDQIRNYQDERMDGLIT